MKHIILYACVTEEEDEEDEEIELYVDYFFFGGIAPTKEIADQIAKSITNDRNIPGVVIPKIYVFDGDLEKVLKQANKYFNQMAVEMYDMAERRQKSHAASDD